VCVCVCIYIYICIKFHEYIGGRECLKNKVRYTLLGLYPKKYTMVPSAHKSLAYLSLGSIGPAIVKNSVG
jgi:hypothetical protein